MENQSYKIPNVPPLVQHPDLPTGCEATELAMLLNWAGLEISKYAVVDALPKGDKVHTVGGERIGANPHYEFVGDPYVDDGSFGVFEGPILEVIEKLMPGAGVDLTGQNFDALLDIVRSGKPVMAWTTIHQRQTYHSDTWIDNEGNTIEWFCNEHAAVIIGMHGDDLLVNDPTTGQTERYARNLFEHNWASMGKRAITLNV